jgi:hypothetical protein
MAVAAEEGKSKLPAERGDPQVVAGNGLASLF